MLRGNKVQICNPGMPKSFYISKEEYATIYPNERSPRRLAITFNFKTKTAWYDVDLANFIIKKYPHIYLYDEKPETVFTDEAIAEIKEIIATIDTGLTVADKSPETAPKTRFDELKALGWVNLSKDERNEYKALKEVANDKEPDSS